MWPILQETVDLLKSSYLLKKSLIDNFALCAVKCSLQFILLKPGFFCLSLFSQKFVGK